MFNGFRFNGVPFNGFFVDALNSASREPDFRWLIVEAQDTQVRVPAQSFSVRVLPENDRLTVPPRRKTITVRKD